MHHQRLGHLRRVGCVVLVASLIAACGDDDVARTAESPTSTADTASSAPDPTSAEEAHVAVAETSLGPVLVDADGMTLYLFTPDSDGTSTCDGKCAEVWPPVVVTGDPVGSDGVDESMLGTTQRSDGSMQLVYAGQPLYRYAEDGEPGDVNGQGVNDVWFAVAPDGTEVREGPSESDGYGY